MIPQGAGGPGAIALRDSSDIFPHHSLVSFIVRSSEHHAGGSAVDPTDPVALTGASRDVAGLLAGAALATGDTRQREALMVAARSLGCLTQTHHRPAPPHRHLSPVRGGS